MHGFMLKRKKHVPELQLTAFELEHKKTGAEYLHVARDDKNNVFSIGFKTNPQITLVFLTYLSTPHSVGVRGMSGDQYFDRNELTLA